jgi:hypothetical protein
VTPIRASSAKAADLRRFLHRHVKSKGTDVETLARIPLADPAELQRLELPGTDAAMPGWRVRACDRLISAGSPSMGRDHVEYGDGD